MPHLPWGLLALQLPPPGTYGAPPAPGLGSGLDGMCSCAAVRPTAAKSPGGFSYGPEGCPSVSIFLRSFGFVLFLLGFLAE